MDSKELVTIYTVSNSAQGEIIKNALQAAGIRCFLDGANQAGEAGLMGIEIKLQVALENVDRARKLIESHEGHRGAAKPRSWTEKKN